MLSSASRTANTAECRQDLAKSTTTPLLLDEIALSLDEIADDRHLVDLDSKLLAREHTTSAVAFSGAALKHWRSSENSRSASEKTDEEKNT